MGNGSFTRTPDPDQIERSLLQAICSRAMADLSSSATPHAIQEHIEAAISGKLTYPTLNADDDERQADEVRERLRSPSRRSSDDPLNIAEMTSSTPPSAAVRRSSVDTESAALGPTRRVSAGTAGADLSTTGRVSAGPAGADSFTSRGSSARPIGAASYSGAIGSGYRQDDAAHRMPQPSVRPQSGWVPRSRSPIQPRLADARGRMVTAAAGG